MVCFGAIASRSDRAARKGRGVGRQKIGEKSVLGKAPARNGTGMRGHVSVEFSVVEDPRNEDRCFTCVGIDGSVVHVLHDIDIARAA
jgi:hypothetical protein